jgi:galactofuranose transport system permease protein
MKLSRLAAIGPLLVTCGVMAALFVFGAIAFPHFASVAVVRNLLVDNAFLGVAAIGATFVILSGGIDLSVGSVMACTSILLATLIERWHVHPLAAIGVVLAAGVVFGTVQGLLIARFDLPAFLVTLAGLFFARGAAFAVHPQSIGIQHSFVAHTLNETLSVPLPDGSGGAIPLTVVVLLVVLLLAWGTLGQTRFGRAVYAVGDDESAAGLMGLSVGATRVRVYAISGGLSALAGVVFALYQQSGDPAACKGLELDAIAAVVIGGTLLRGGVGSVIGSLVGVLILGLIQTIISFQGNLSSWWARIVAGGLVLLFLCLHRMLSRVSRGQGGAAVS